MRILIAGGIVALSLLIITSNSIAQSTPASKIKYSSKNSGLKASTVQQAVDDIATSISGILKKKGGVIKNRALNNADSTVTCTGKLYDVCDNNFNEDTVTVTFSRTSETEGTFTSSPILVMTPYPTKSSCNDQFPGNPYSLLGTWSGSYRLVGNTIFGFDLVAPNGSVVGSGRTGIVEVRDETLTISNTSFTPQPVVVLRCS